MHFIGIISEEKEYSDIPCADERDVKKKNARTRINTGFWRFIRKLLTGIGKFTDQKTRKERRSGTLKFRM